MYKWIFVSTVSTLGGGRIDFVSYRPDDDGYLTGSILSILPNNRAYMCIMLRESRRTCQPWRHVKNNLILKGASIEGAVSPFYPPYQSPPVVRRIIISAWSQRHFRIKREFSSTLTLRRPRRCTHLPFGVCHVSHSTVIGGGTYCACAVIFKSISQRLRRHSLRYNNAHQSRHRPYICSQPRSLYPVDK